MADFPFTDEELIARSKALGTRLGGDSADDIEGLDDSELADIGDDAWYHGGWMEFENDPRLEEHQEAFSALATKLKLSSVFIKAFVVAIKARG